MPDTEHTNRQRLHVTVQLFGLELLFLDFVSQPCILGRVCKIS